MRNPWKTLSSDVVYENPWIRVEDRRVVTPAGTPGQYGKVCFKNAAVAILPLDERDETCLVGQYRYTLDEYSWELPMGGAPLDTDPLEAARRELREETGLAAREWNRILRVHVSNSITDEVGIVYVARGLEQGAADPEETEQLALRRLPFEEAVEWALDGRITDALSVAGLLAAAARGEGRR